MVKKRFAWVLVVVVLAGVAGVAAGEEEVFIVVSKTPRGTYANEEITGISRGAGWYEIGLSRNGEEPIEYIWRALKDEWGYIIIQAKIGDKGTIDLCIWAKEINLKLPQPNAEKPPIIGMLGEVNWNRIDPVSDSEDRAR